VNQRSVLTVSTLLEGEYGRSDVCQSVPCAVDETGVAHAIEARLPAEEQAGLERSAGVLKQAIEELGNA
jgi:L-lactate dehydrogenase